MSAVHVFSDGLQYHALCARSPEYAENQDEGMDTAAFLPGIRKSKASAELAALRTASLAASLVASLAALSMSTVS